MTTLRWASNASALVFFLTAHPLSAFASRKVSTVLASSRAEAMVPASPGHTASAIFRMRVNLKNVGSVEQNVTVTLKDIHADVSILFASAAGAATLPSWSNAAGGNWRSTTFDPPPYVKTFRMSPDQNLVLNASVQCFYEASRACMVTDSEVWAATIDDVTDAMIDGHYSVQVEIAEDRGAMLGSMWTQSQELNTNAYVTTTESAPVNGGRAF